MLHSCDIWYGMLCAYFVVRQGGHHDVVLSRFLFNVHVDDLLNEML